MNYKTIVVHVDATPQAHERVVLAGIIARSQQAHLIGTATAPLSNLYEARRSIVDALGRFDTQSRSIDVSCERRLSDHDPQTNLILQARQADLLVLSQSIPHGDDGGQPRHLPEYVALHAGRPILVVPHTGTYQHLDQHALIAWDGSQAATRAVTDALPLLRHSLRITLVMFPPTPQSSIHAGKPGADIAMFLARHGVQVQVMEHTVMLGMSVGESLLSLAEELNADLLVMGAYGHPRWNEIVLGGATRTLLRSMTLPVLMSH
ncbi:universal stress protein [Janthinobacterium sp. GW458P]|uniref:universal stress protein n=1 Tax=Janthinobacterium sp. GW458P TaxID=1981504 RepID=UPI000A324BF9|nr:universal stress protein [Janthinobacterium sp. GW458P]MBE3024312.1 universal stress protein [Janthinobacterium sp. GW458P]PHV13742.1 universal stress protein [Janthinobacterium sp. BJB303]